MKPSGKAILAVLSLAASLCRPGPAGSAAAAPPEPLQQQRAAELSSCPGVLRSLARGTDPALVVRTAVELGYNACQVLQCALGSAGGPDRPQLCDRVIRGAVAAGVNADVIARCSADACDPKAAAATLAATLLEPNYCYFSPQGFEPGLPPRGFDPSHPAPDPIIERTFPRPQASPFSF